jgi:hypothetical protein
METTVCLDDHDRSHNDCFVFLDPVVMVYHCCTDVPARLSHRVDAPSLSKAESAASEESEVKPLRECASFWKVSRRFRDTT